MTDDDKVSIDGADSPRLVINGLAAMNEAAERLFLACRNILIVRAPRLDLDFYFTESFTECCQSIVVRSLRNELMFLVEDEKHLLRANIRLVALARQFSSYVKIRVIPEELVGQQEMFIVCDATGYLHQPSVDHARGLMSISDRGTARQLALRFKDLWERSPQPEELFTTGL